MRDTAVRCSKLPSSYYRNANALIVLYEESADESGQTSLVTIRNRIIESQLDPRGIVIAVWGTDSVVESCRRDKDDTTAQIYLTSLAKLYEIPPQLIRSFQVDNVEDRRRLAKAFKDVIKCLMKRKREGTLKIANNDNVIDTIEETPTSNQGKCHC